MAEKRTSIKRRQSIVLKRINSVLILVICAILPDLRMSNAARLRNERRKFIMIEKKYVIVGGSHGIGLGLVKRLVSSGAAHYRRLTDC